MMHAMEVASSPLRPSPSRNMRGWRILTATLVATGLTLSFAHAQTATTPNNTRRFALAVNKTLEQGHDAFLPPHISHLLGISPSEQKVAVKQVAEMGETIRGFEVSSARHDDIVIFVENRSRNESMFYLLSSKGALRRVVSLSAPG